MSRNTPYGFDQPEERNITTVRITREVLPDDLNCQSITTQTLNVGGAELEVEENAFSFSGVRTGTLHIDDERFIPNEYLKKGEEEHENLKFEHI